MSRETLEREAVAERDGLRPDEAALLEIVPRRSPLRDVWVGVFVLAAVLAALTALFLLTDASTFRGRYVASTVVEDAGGIRKGDPVQMRGVNIGRIQAFEMVPGGVVIRLEIEGEYDVPADSRVVLRSGGLLGGMIAEIVPGRSGTTLEGGETLPGISTGGFTDLAAGLESRAEVVLERAQDLLSPTTIEAVGGSAQELQRTLSEAASLVAGQREEIAALVASLRRAGAGLESAAAGGPDIARAAARLDSLTARLDTTVATIGRSSAALELVLERIQRGEGTLGRLSTDPSLYESVERAADQIAQLAEDLRLNPGRYLDVSVF